MKLLSFALICASAFMGMAHSQDPFDDDATYNSLCGSQAHPPKGTRFVCFNVEPTSTFYSSQATFWKLGGQTNCAVVVEKGGSAWEAKTGNSEVQVVTSNKEGCAIVTVTKDGTKTPQEVCDGKPEITI